MKKNLIKSILLTGSFILPLLVAAQKDTTLVKSEENYERVRKNTIRWNPTPNLVFNTTTAIFGYERVLNERQSFSLNIGYMEFPKLLPGFIDSLVNYNYTRNSGFNLAVDYRFYLQERNKFPIPDGFYIGPYMSFYNFNVENDVSIFKDGLVTNSFTIESRLGFYGIGFQAGYQFVIKERFALDLLLFGPSIVNYRFRAKIIGDLSADEENEQLQQYLDILINSFPWLEPFLEGTEIDTSGRLKHSGVGFRYAIMIGYRF